MSTDDERMSGMRVAWSLVGAFVETGVIVLVMVHEADRIFREPGLSDDSRDLDSWRP